MGLNALGAWIQAGSAFTGIGDSVAIGRVLYDSGFPIIPADNLWVPTRENSARFTVVPIGDIHIFIGETNLPPPRKLISGGSVWLKSPYGPLSSWIRRRNNLIWNFPSYLD
jgi:hypothetical protein